MTDALSHADFRAELAELALGVLDGRERAMLLDHVAGCLDCSAELEQLTLAVDGLVHIAPAVDPPVGFESRVLAELQDAGPESMTSRRKSKWRPVASIAAAVVVAFGIGWIAHPAVKSQVHMTAGAPTAGGYRTADLVADGRTLGDASIYGHGPAWLFMAVEDSPGASKVRCTVTTEDGTIHVVGSFDLQDGRGDWSAPLWVGKSPIKSAQLVGAGGEVLASATFS